MVKLIKNIRNHLRPSGSSQFSLSSNKIKNSARDALTKSLLSESRIGDIHRYKWPKGGIEADSVVVGQPSIGWDGSSVVLVGFKRFPPTITSDQNSEENSSSRASCRASESSDSAVASCILAYGEESFGVHPNSDHSFPSFSSPNSSVSCSSSVHKRASGGKSVLSHEPYSFPEAIKTLPSHFLSSMEFDRHSAVRRFHGNDISAKRRTSTIQPFPSAFRVLLESGETRSFRYDSETTVSDILAQLQEKLGISVIQHFGFVLRRANEVVFVLPETMKISEFVDWCAANEYEAALRVVFPPKQPEDFLLVDPVAFDYLFTQCTNDVLAGRFEAELGADKAIYLSALHILQFAVASNLSGKLTIRRIDKEFGLENFIPSWVRERGRGKSVEQAVAESLRHLTDRQRGAGQQSYKMQYVKLLSLMSDYGAHSFPAILLGFTEEKCSILLGPLCGISYLPASLPQTKPVFLIRFEHIRCIELRWNGQSSTNITCNVHHVIKDITPIQFLLPRWLRESFIFVLRRYRRLLVSTNGDVTIIENSDEQTTTAAPAPAPAPATTDNTHTATPKKKADCSAALINGRKSSNHLNYVQRSLAVRPSTKQTRQALLLLNVGQTSETSANGTDELDQSSSQNHLLLTESTSCPNISEIVESPRASSAVNTSSAEESNGVGDHTESGIGSEMDSPRSHQPTSASPQSSEGLLEMRFDPPPGFGDSEDETKCVIDNPLCEEDTQPPPPQIPPPPPPPPQFFLNQASPTGSSVVSRAHSIDDIVVSFNLALKGTFGDEEDSQPTTVWSVSSCSENKNVVTVALSDEMPPPPLDMNDSTNTVDSITLPPAESAPPPPPPYAFPLQDSSNVGVSSESGAEDISPIPTINGLNYNGCPSDQLRGAITRILLNRSESMDVDERIETTIADSSALRFALTIFGNQDLPAGSDALEPTPDHSFSSALDDLSDKLVTSSRVMLASVGNNNKSALSQSSSEVLLDFGETAGFLLDSYCSLGNDESKCPSAQRICQLSSGLTQSLDAFSCCLQSGLAVVEEQLLSQHDSAEESGALNEKLKRLLMNAAWLARSLAVFASLTLQVKQEAVAGEVNKCLRDDEATSKL